MELSKVVEILQPFRVLYQGKDAICYMHCCISPISTSIDIFVKHMGDEEDVWLFDLEFKKIEELEITLNKWLIIANNIGILLEKGYDIGFSRKLNYCNIHYKNDNVDTETEIEIDISIPYF
jgi:hypothetical protein